MKEQQYYRREGRMKSKDYDITKMKEKILPGGRHAWI